MSLFRRTGGEEWRIVDQISPGVAAIQTEDDPVSPTGIVQGTSRECEKRAVVGELRHAAAGFALRTLYRNEIKGKHVLLADDVRNTGETFARAAALAREAGATVLATVEIYDRLEAITDLGVPNISLAEYKAPDNYKVGECPLCKNGVPITRF